MTASAPETHGKCAICGRPVEAAYRPFCSRRCADVDLSRWLHGAYAIPTEPDDEEDAAASPGPTDANDDGRKT